MKNIENDLGQAADTKEDTNASIERVGTQNENPPVLSSEEQEVKELHRQIVGIGHKTLELAIQIGEKLQILKKQKGHGKWEDYVTNKLGIQPRTASNYLRVAENQEGLRKSEDYTDLTFSEALDLIRDRKKSEKQDDFDSAQDEPPEPFTLADESTLDPRKIDWQDGLLDLKRVKSRLAQMAKGPKKEGDLPMPRQQQVFLRLASAINSECGTADHEDAATLVRAAFKEIEALLDDLIQSSSSKSDAA